MSAITNFANLVRELRKLRELTQEELAHRTGRSVDAISQWERGINWPNFETLILLGEALNVPVTAFFVEAGDGQSQDRVNTEMRALALLRDLSDDDLLIAIDQIKALSRRKIGK